MSTCKDGRKHVIVSGYQTKTGTTVSRYERSCPQSEDKPNNDGYICCVCGGEYGNDDIHTITIKGQPRSICNECVDTIHGLI
jgi:hypothetical protein